MEMAQVDASSSGLTFCAWYRLRASGVWNTADSGSRQEDCWVHEHVSTVKSSCRPRFDDGCMLAVS
jgi:hypothetical protein